MQSARESGIAPFEPFPSVILFFEKYHFALLMARSPHCTS
jgi:hypothetical protein